MGRDKGRVRVVVDYRNGVPWEIMARADTMDNEILKAMADAGVYAAKYAVGSGVHRIVDASNKNLELN